MARRMTKIDGVDCYGLQGWRTRPDWDVWSVVAVVVILLAGLWGLAR